MQYDDIVKYDEKAGDLVVRLVQPKAAIAQLDLWDSAEGLFSEFSVDKRDADRNKALVWAFDPVFWSQRGCVLECWGSNTESRFAEEDTFTAAIEVHQGEKRLLTVEREFPANKEETRFSIRVLFNNSNDYFDDSFEEDDEIEGESEVEP